MRILGLDPGLRHTGWGIIELDSNRLHHVANGVVNVDPAPPLAQRLASLHQELTEIVKCHQPDEAAVEETFVNSNPASTLKLGQARGVVMLVPAQAGLLVASYSPNTVKKAVVGAGHAAKQQIGMMVRTLLPGCDIGGADAADALAVAICHAHLRGSAMRLATAVGVQ
jgi:crossover junction endodeoxyribonuclease RuvC